MARGRPGSLAVAHYLCADDDVVTVLLLCCWSLMLVEGVAVAGRNDVQILGTSAVLKKRNFVIFRFFFK